MIEAGKEEQEEEHKKKSRWRKGKQIWQPTARHGTERNATEWKRGLHEMGAEGLKTSLFLFIY